MPDNINYNRNETVLKEEIIAAKNGTAVPAEPNDDILIPDVMPRSFSEDEGDSDADASFDLDEGEDADTDVSDESLLPAIQEEHLPSIAVRDTLRAYLRQISRFPMLTPDEEQELTRRVRDTGDPDAAFRIVTAHLRLVVKIAMDFQRRWMQNVLDLIQEGNVGLMRAVEKFDPDKGIKFSYYASFWIRAYILKFIMDNWRMVKIGTTQAQRKLFYNLNRERNKLIAQGFDPDAETLSKRLGVSPDQILEMQSRLDAGDVSLDVPVGGDPSGTTTQLDLLSSDEPGTEYSFGSTEMSSLIRERLESIIPKLSEKEVYILENRLLTDEPVTLREIGDKYHVTRERIRQLESRLLEKLRKYFSDEISDFSDEWIEV
ncbi:MAG: RNA polymerase factor sigma-32 [Mailhella sp.]|nr:RNA polymerase factor sigma-32 [Mailhella sp.]